MMRACSGREGQMAVELAILVPVAIVVALISLNLMRFVDACAAFDRMSLDAVVAQGVSPAGDQSGALAAEQVRTCIADALGREDVCEVEVSAESCGGASLLTRYICTLVFKPWPRVLRLPVVSLEAPFGLRHQRELVVDRYRPGVVF